MIICYTVPEIYGVWWMSLLFFNVGYFLLFYPPNSPKKENLKKKKKKETTTTTWRYHHFTQVYQKSWSYAMLFLRYMVRDGCNCYFSFWAIFCPFTALTAQKIKISKKTQKQTKANKANKQTNKKHLEISFYTRVPKTMIRWCTVSDIWCTTDRRTEKMTYRGWCPT